MEWISVKDRLPDIGVEVLVLRTRDRRVTALSRFIRYEGAIEYHWDNYYPGSGNLHLAKGISHWMPLPEPPQEVGADE